ncbi:hypothetical protein DRW41_10995 [Neobacillus piezotolerans]|uniref:Squalene cyclase C-terminal domain-containing protein n=1 Tax=Neobacillus piezotolerans TaxID=2259171 RepID=A0A3D8GRY2_9BACI|nr:hypothetical protein DRW41_10995 [Neobacillus piezotolerans]
MNSKARGLERSRFEFIFENGRKENVLTELKKFQNEDGGFGHGIEPDFWLPNSSPMATWAAGQILMEIGADKNKPIVQSMVSYLANSIDNETGMWRSVLPENNEYPHAPWWHWHEGVQENWSFNPSAELAAFLVHWSDEESEAAELGWRVIRKAIDHLMGKSEMDRHEINNYQALVEIMKPRLATFESKINHSLNEVSEQVMVLAEKCVNKDVSTWTEGYQPLPLDFINDPSDRLCERLGTLVEENFDFYKRQASDEGIWDISWNWGSYPEEYEIARGFWKGILAVNRYKQFKAFGYLKPMDSKREILFIKPGRIR